MKKNIVARVQRFYKDRLAFYTSLKEEALEKARENSEIGDIEKRLKEIKGLALQGKLDESVNREYDELAKRYNTLVKTYLPTIKYECDICHDTGVHGNKYCKCFMNRYLDELKKEANIDMLPQFKFEDNNISSYPMSEENKARYTKVYAKLEEFANNYPDTEKFNIFLRGQSGSGKTCLVSAVANRLIERGKAVQYITAFDLGELMLRSHLDYKNNSLSMITDAEVLVIDDLGSEPMRANINETYLQSILDSRIAHRKATLVTTNLTAEQLMRKYGERVISRLLNKSDTIAIDFMSTPNLRTTKKR